MTVQVARDQKVGNFTVAFQDLNIPVAGIPITITRVYDSRDKAVGDFGYGWRLDLQTLRLRAEKNQGVGWQVSKSGNFQPPDYRPPTYTLASTRSHKVSLHLPDGKVEEFDLAPSPSSSVIVPFRFLYAAYEARSGTLGTLVALDNTRLYVSGNQPGFGGWYLGGSTCGHPLYNRIPVSRRNDGVSLDCSARS